MDSTVVRRLLEINRQFYTDFGAHFSATRQRIQPGVHKILSGLVESESMLDLGCGNGELARTLAQNKFCGTYTGLDFSLPLLVDAKSQPDGFSASFFEADLTAQDWEQSLGSAQYSLITAFAVLHHIPDRNLRRSIFLKVHSLLAPGGKFIHSNWQFLNSAKLKNRIQPWEAAGLSATNVDEGDYLLDWRGGGSGLRYVHHFSADELDQAANETGFQVKETFFSDGEGGRLGLYQFWERHEK
jgi:2-polyprenyl-3-methyl-5-hydroxy-6-metoxy-1,4-benzoquinol methylase